MSPKHRLKLPFISANKQDLMVAAAITSILFFALGVLATYIFAHNLSTRQDAQHQQNVAKELRTTSNYARAKIANYSQVLLSAAAAINVRGADNLNNDDWSIIYQSSHVQTAFPEILALGYTKNSAPVWHR